MYFSFLYFILKNNSSEASSKDYGFPFSFHNSVSVIPCYRAVLKTKFKVRFSSIFSYHSAAIYSMLALSLFVESWKLGQSLKFCGTYFPARLVEFYMATAVHWNCCRNISIHSENISLLSFKGNKISGICDYPCHLRGNFLLISFSPVGQHGFGV